MEWQADSNTVTEQTSETTSQIDITLDFQTIGALDFERLYSQLNSGRDAIREQIFRVIAEQVVPGMVASMGTRPNQPEQSIVRSQIDTHWSLDTGKAGDGQLLTRHLMGMHIEAQSDQPMNSAAMLQVGREGVAAAVADLFAHSLEQFYLGKTKSEDHSESSMRGDDVVAYRPGASGR